VVEAYYDEHAQEEWARLEQHRTEFAVTLWALEEYLPPPRRGCWMWAGGRDDTPLSFLAGDMRPCCSTLAEMPRARPEEGP
jgi:hypothetical protein